MIDYNQYVYTAAERIRYGMFGGAAGFVILMLFYDQLIFCGICAVPAGVLFLRLYRNRLIEKRRWELTIQFKDAMESMVSALVAGYSLENSVRQAHQDLKVMYREDDVIMREFSYMMSKMDLKAGVETLIEDLGTRSGVEDIRTFSEILSTAKKTGGNLVQVMRKTAGNISQKMEIKREIETMIAGKKMESNCMTAIPLLMIAYLRVFSPGFLDPLYHNMSGILVMTGALLLYSVSVLWGQKIMKIEF